MTYPPPQGTLDLITILKAAYPVGAVYISVSSTSPATLFGFGTWAAFGAGKCLVGLDSADADFDTAEETGGAKTHTLQTSEIPSHTHALQYAGYYHAEHGTFGADTHWMFNGDYIGDATGATGGGGAHNNVQPYIVVYMWKRTA